MRVVRVAELVEGAADLSLRPDGTPADALVVVDLDAIEVDDDTGLSGFAARRLDGRHTLVVGIATEPVVGARLEVAHAADLTYVRIPRERPDLRVVTANGNPRPRQVSEGERAWLRMLPRQVVAVPELAPATDMLAQRIAARPAEALVMTQVLRVCAGVTRPAAVVVASLARSLLLAQGVLTRPDAAGRPAIDPVEEHLRKVVGSDFDEQPSGHEVRLEAGAFDGIPESLCVTAETLGRWRALHLGLVGPPEDPLTLRDWGLAP